MYNFHKKVYNLILNHKIWTTSLTLENKFIFHTVWKEKNAAHLDSGLSFLVVNVFTAYFIIASKIKNSSSSLAEILSIPLYEPSQHWCRFSWAPIPLSLDSNPEKISFPNIELTQRDGRGKKTANLVCVTSVTVILFETTFRQTSPSFKQIFWYKTTKHLYCK